MKPNDKILDMLPNLLEIGYINNMKCYTSNELFIYTFDDILYCMDVEVLVKYKFVTMSSLLSGSNFLHLINNEINIMPNTIMHSPSYDLYASIYISNDIIRKVKLNFATLQ